MSSHHAMNPDGGASVRRVVEPPDPNERLLERIMARENLQSAWKRVESSKGMSASHGAGTDADL
jgi:hypothetical protein